MPTVAKLGRYKLRLRPDAGSYEVAWRDGDGRARRHTFGTRDPGEAEREFGRWVAANGELRAEAPKSMPLAQLFIRYHENHAKALPSGREQQRHLAYWNEFYGPAHVADLTSAKQDEFVASLKQKGYSGGYIKRILASGAAALNWCHGRGELAAVPKILTVKGGGARERTLDPEEILTFWNAIQEEELARYFMILLNTGCRPEAARDLTVFQIKRDGTRLDLNPAGREQTHKVRPVVPIAATLGPWLDVKGRERLIGRGEKWLGDRWRETRERAGLDPAVVPYTLRHTLATVLDEQGVDENQISAFMGWLPANRMRAHYTKRRWYRPEYCQEVVTAIDAMFAELAVLNDERPAVTRRPFVPSNQAARANSVPGARGKSGAGEGIRTLDPNLGKVVLYP
jgi:integrase